MAITRAEANKIIKENMKGILAEEVNYIVDEYKDTEWNPDYVEALYHYDGSDFYYGKFKREHTRLLKLIGMLVRIKPGQDMVIYSLGRTRKLKVGDWCVDHSYSQFEGEDDGEGLGLCYGKKRY